MDRIAAVALLDWNAAARPNRREFDSVAAGGRVDLLTIGAVAMSARAQAIAVCIAAILIGGIGGMIGEAAQAVPYRVIDGKVDGTTYNCLLYTSPSPRDA